MEDFLSTACTCWKGQRPSAISKERVGKWAKLGHQEEEKGNWDTKVSQLEFSSLIDKQILGLEVSM